MLADNTVLLGIIALLNGAYLYQQRNQRTDFKEMIHRIETLTGKLMIMETEHKIFHPESSVHEENACKPLKKAIKVVVMILFFIGINILVMYSTKAL